MPYPRGMPLMSTGRPMSSPVLLGRDDLLDLVQRRITAAGEGDGEVLFLAGEAGIGKTRLLGVVGRRAAAAGFDVVEAAAFPHDIDVAGALLVDLASNLRRSGTARWTEVADQLRERLTAPPPADAGDQHRERRLLVTDLADLVGSLAGDAPLLLAFEDLHWVDELTLEVLGHLAARTRGAAILVVATYRSDELYPRAPMRTWRARLLTQRLAEEAQLSRLTVDQTASMANALLGEVLPNDTLVALHGHSDGIPLHVEEILAVTAQRRDGASGAPGDHHLANALPDTLAAAVLARAQALTASARRVADVAAVIGRTFHAALVAAASGVPRELVDDALDELVRHFFVEAGPRPSGSFDFRHALIRDAFVDALPTSERRRLHLAVADAARAADPDVPDAFLASHYDEAGSREPAYELSRRAAERAVSLSSHREAVQLLGRALRNRPETATLHQRAELELQYADACAAVDDNDGAAKAYASAREQLLVAGDRIAAAAAVPRLVAVRHLLGDDLETRVGMVEAALADLDESAEPAEPATAVEITRVRGRLLAASSAAYMLDRRLDDAIERGRAAHALAIEVEDEPTEMHSTVTVGSCLLFAGEMDEGWSMLERAVDQARGARREEETARAYRMIGTSASVLVEYDRADQWLPAGIDYAERCELWNHRHYMSANLGHVRWATGDWSAALDLAQHALADGRGGITTRVTSLLVLGYVALGRGDWSRAAAVLDEAREIGTSMGELQRLSPALWGAAEMALLQQRYDQCVEVCRQARAASAAVDDAAYLFPFLLTGTRALLERGDPAGAQTWCEDVAAAVERRGIPGTLPAVAHARGLVALGAGSTGQARTALTAASRGWTERRRVWEGVRAQLDLSRCEIRANRPREALAAATVAREAAVTVGATPLTQLAESAATAARSRGAAPEPWEPLTRREFEVAALVADGRTNKEIAQALRISPKTVASHVEHILTRLGVVRRAAIAQWVGSVRVDQPG